jgi:hypothetical protein
VIARVIAGGPDEWAGRGAERARDSDAITVGAVITHVDDKPVESLDELPTILDHHAVGVERDLQQRPKVG